MNSRTLLSVALFAALSACRTSGWYDYGFLPAPLEAQVMTEADPSAQVRVLVSIRGIARGQDGRADAAEVRMRLENLGNRAASLVEPSLSLVSADLEVFEAPGITPPGPHTVAPGDSRTIDLVFPLPQGRQHSDINLRGLNLRWTLSFEGREVTTGASFQLDVPIRVYDDEPHVHFGIGVGTHI